MFQFIHNARARSLVKRVNREYKVDGVYVTPDAPEIDKSEMHLVLIYDDMMKDRQRYDTIQRLSKGYAGRSFAGKPVKAYRNGATSDVVAFEAREQLPDWAEPGDEPSLPIRGDLFLVGRQAMYTLDRLFKNGVEYQRTRISTETWVHKEYYSHAHSRVHITDQVARHRQAWVYMGNPDFWEVTAYSWSPLAYFKSRKTQKPRYYYYNKYLGGETSQR